MNDQPANPAAPPILPPDGCVQPNGSDLAKSATTAEAQHLAHKIFIGPDGLRALWRLLMYAALVFVISFAAIQVRRAIGFKFSTLGEQNSPTFIIATRTESFLAMLLAAFIMSKIERRPVGVYGLPARGAFGKRFWEGVFWGFVSLSVLLVLLRITGAFYFGSVALSLQSALRYAAIWGVAFLLVAFMEEYMFRGYIQYTLTTGIGFWPTAVLLSFLFALAHKANPGETWLGLVDVFLAGIVLAAMLIRTGNLWLPVGFHLGWDWAESYFYGVADSGMQAKGALLHPTIPAARAWWLTGGTVGPEGSIFSCIVEILLIVFILWRFRGNRYPAAEQPQLVTAA
jgi:membrane protease YdiL (CAAX protease family)